MKDIGILRPRETGIIGSKPGFRRMHQVIQHARICRRLDLWRVAAKRWNPTVYTNLEEFARAKPSLEELQAIARDIVLHDMGRPLVVCSEREKSEEERDEQWENSSILNYYFMLYEELTYAMNHGDIMRVEMCFLPWINIFKSCGKHKYAQFLVKHLDDVHFKYNDDLRRAVRYSMLVNPTGKPDGFRAPDWCMELNNLYTKVIYGGEGSSHTVERIIDESPLIQIFRNIHITFERNLVLTHLTKRHVEPNMHLTFEEVLSHLEREGANVRQPGYKAVAVIADHINEGYSMFASGEEKTAAELAAAEVGKFEDSLEMWDVAGEIEGL